MQQLGAGFAREQRKQNLIPPDATIEPPGIERFVAQLDGFDALIAQRGRQTASVLANSRRRADGQLGIQGNLHSNRRYAFGSAAPRAAKPLGSPNLPALRPQAEFILSGPKGRPRKS